MAVTGGADLITFGPVWATPSKPAGPLRPGESRVQPVGLEELGRLTAAVPVPVFALGGIDDEARAAAIYAAILLRFHPRLKASVAAKDWPAGGAAMNAIRMLVLVNRSLGVLTVVVALLGE